MNYSKVFIIILNWNGLQDTLECLESVYKLDYPNFEVIVVDNGSRDNSVEVIHKMYPQVILIENKENLGFTGGNNIGIKYAIEHNANYVWVLNNDTIVEGETLKKLVNVAEGSGEVGTVSPIIYDYDNPEIVQFCGCYIDWDMKKLIKFKNIEDAILGQKTMPNQIWLWGTALLIKINVILKVGYFDNNYFAYWEDVDYSIRTNKAGYKNVVDYSSRIYHKLFLNERGDINRSPYYLYYILRNEYLFWVKYLESLSKIIFLKNYLGGVIISGGTCFNAGAYESADACIMGAWDGICGVYGPWGGEVKETHLLMVAKKVLFWHPNLWGNLFRGNYKDIFYEVLKRTNKYLKINSKRI
jgi:GT2 family glycosyltransferase